MDNIPPPPRLRTDHYLTNVFRQHSNEDHKHWAVSTFRVNSIPLYNPQHTTPEITSIILHAGDKIVVTPSVPINFRVNYIIPPLAMGLESVGCHIGAFIGTNECYIEAMVSGKIAVLQARSDQLNRMSMAAPKTGTHQFHFLRIAERLRLNHGDIVLFYNADPLKNAELLMATSIASTREFSTDQHRGLWKSVHAFMHNKLLEMWELVKDPLKPHLYLKAPSYSGIPIKIDQMNADQFAASYFNASLFPHIAPAIVAPAALPSGSPVAMVPSSSGSPAAMVASSSGASASRPMIPAPQSSTFRFGASDDKPVAKKPRT